jgi:AdoMet-dependent heme synthase
MSEARDIARRLAAWDDGPKGPWTLEIYPTLACNLRCVFCDAALRKAPASGELSLPRWLGILDEAARMGVRRVFVLGGGEPLVASDRTPAILRRIKALGLEGVLGTNGTLLHPTLVRQLVETGWDEVHFSVDGADGATHDALRGVPGAFQKVISAICRLRTARDMKGQDRPRIALHFVVTSRNWSALPAMVRLASDLGAFRVDFDALVAFRAQQRALLLDRTQAAKLADLAAAALVDAERLGLATTLPALLRPETLDRDRTEVASAPHRDALPSLPVVGAAPCLKAWHYLVIQQDGRTSPCCVLAGSGDGLGSGTLADLWERQAALGAVRAAMVAGQPMPRCGECSENILGHERAIRAELESLRGRSA